MDFVTRLPCTPKEHDAIWVIVDQMTKSAHFLPAKTTFNSAQYAQLYIDETLKLHGILISIISVALNSLHTSGELSSKP